MRQKNPNFFGKKEEKKSNDLGRCLKRGQESGNVNASNRDLSTFPEDLCKFSELRLLDNWWDAMPLLKIDIANNQISQLPDQLATQAELQNLNMMNNQLRDLPASLFTLKNLKLIDFSSNLLENLPPSIGECTSLVQINLQINKLQSIPDSIGDLFNLEVGDFSQNQIGKIPMSVGLLNKLKRFNLSSNKLQVIPNAIGQLVNLEDINLSKNVIHMIDENSLKLLDKLTILDLTQNQLTYFSEVPESVRLDTLILAYNRINRLENLMNAPNLTVLDINNNKIMDFPSNVLKMTNLKTLNLGNNDLSDLPAELSLLENLVRINLEGNSLKAIKPSIRRAGAEELKKYLRMKLASDPEEQKYNEDREQVSASGNPLWDTLIREYLIGSRLILTNMKLTEIHPHLWNYDKITDLNLSGNGIVEIPDGIKLLISLQNFTISNNKISKISFGLAMLSKLITLDLSNNQIVQLFYMITPQNVQMDNLRLINLSKNKIIKIPSFLKYLSKLDNLAFSYNSISDFTKLARQEFGNLSSLDASNNQINTVPSSITIYLTKLVFLDIRNNNITRIPSSLGTMEKLQTLGVDGNPLKLIRMAIIQKGPGAVIQYLRERYNPGTDTPVDTPLYDSDEDPRVPKILNTQIAHVDQAGYGVEEIKENREAVERPMEAPQFKPMEVDQGPTSMVDIPQLPTPTPAVTQSTVMELKNYILNVERQILALNKEIDENYSLSTVKRNEKKRLIVKLMIDKNQKADELARYQNCDKYISYSKMYKILVIGDSNTGKTSLVNRFVYNKFDSNYKATIACEFALKIFELQGHTVRLQLWDIAGQDRMGGIPKIFCKDAVGAVIVSDITDESTLNNVEEWKSQVDQHAALANGEQIPMLLLANKSDLIEKYGIEELENFQKLDYLNAFASNLNLVGAFQTSAMTNNQVDNAFMFLVQEILKRNITVPRPRLGTTKIINNKKKIARKGGCCK